MSLAEDKLLIEVNETDFLDAAAAIMCWEQCPASALSHHGETCCDVAREWVLSMDYSQLAGDNLLSGPRWLRHKYTWGPSRWPLFWCEAVERKTLDCGALSALACEVFMARGLKCYPAQLIQQYTEDSTRHWHKRWIDDESSTHWIKDDLIYHEGCAMRVRDNEIKVWDASAGWWINPKQFGGYGGLLALRVCDKDSNSHQTFNWGAHSIRTNRWEKIERARRDFA